MSEMPSKFSPSPEMSLVHFFDPSSLPPSHPRIAIVLQQAVSALLNGRTNGVTRELSAAPSRDAAAAAAAAVPAALGHGVSELFPG